jgi:tRNA pseudouridine55 synthase
LLDGLVVVDKTAGWTSHDVVAKCRGIFGQRRIGHSGTLDPDATGVLLVGLGRVTRLLRFLTDLPKSYTGEVVLGVETSTLDAAGAVTATHDMSVTPEQVAAAAVRFTGRIKQVPPMVSAVKVGGRRLHELARAGIEVEREAREVTVTRFDVAPTADPLVYRIEVGCSSGTYVRTLAADLGAALGGGAHLRDLRRTAIGSFGVGEARPLEALSAEPTVLTPAEAMRDYPSLVLDPAAVANGRVLDLDLPGPTAVVSPDGALLAMYEPHGPGRAKPAVVVAPQ